MEKVLEIFKKRKLQDKKIGLRVKKSENLLK